MFNIPIVSTDSVLRTLDPSPIYDTFHVAKSINVTEEKEHLKHNIMTNFRFDFVQRTILIDYYGYVDILSELGGLANMAKIGMASMATVHIIRFMMMVVYHIRKGYKFKKFMMDFDSMKEVLP